MKKHVRIYSRLPTVYSQSKAEEWRGIGVKSMVADADNDPVGHP